MNVAIVTRYPRIDTAVWKQEVAERLFSAGATLTVVYTRSSLVDQARAGVAEFGADAWNRYRDARSQSQAPRATLAEWAHARGVEVLRFRRIDEPALSRALMRRDVELLVLAGAEIVPADVLEIPSRGTLNAHFGLLPRYRGMNVAEWSIYHNDPVGVSVHFVDRGIDTGDVVAARPILVRRGDTLETIRDKQRREAASMLVDAVAAIRSDRVRRATQAAAEGTQFYRMHPAIRQHVEAKLQRATYAWLDRLPDPPSW